LDTFRVAAELNEWLLGIDDFPNHHVRVFLVYSPTALWWNCWNADGHVLGSLWITLVVKQDISKSKRCPWVDLTKPDYVEYHDREWGVPVHDDKAIFEFLTLEAAQAGLSWYTVLRKREAYRAAFAGFDPEKVARYGKREIASLLGNEGIIRNQAKILAAINNAKKFLDVQEEFGGFDAYIWRFVAGKPVVHRLRTLKDYRATSPESDALSKDLKQRGFKFVGSTICYAHMQATGMVNDHVAGCFRRHAIIAAYKNATIS
jgi:DNA-3-methyladenine glycosylase I